MKKLFLMGFVMLAVLAGSTAAFSSGREGRIQAGGGLGLTLNPPVRFDINFNGEYFLTHHISLGMNLDILLRGATTFIFQPFARYNFDLDFAPRWVPYAGGGIGMGVNTNGGGILDLMLPDVGFNYELLDDKLFVGSDLSLHLVTNFDNTDWDLRFLVARAEFRF